jgi:hypothetical protein
MGLACAIEKGRAGACDIAIKRARAGPGRDPAGPGRAGPGRCSVTAPLDFMEFIERHINIFAIALVARVTVLCVASFILDFWSRHFPACSLQEYCFTIS